MGEPVTLSHFTSREHKGTKERVTEVWLELLQMPLMGPLWLDTATRPCAKLSLGGKTRHPLQTSDKEETLGEDDGSDLG